MLYLRIGTGSVLYLRMGTGYVLYLRNRIGSTGPPYDHVTTVKNHDDTVMCGKPVLP